MPTSPSPPLPNAPSGVRYALTVPQSVLFAELSLDGNRRWSFAEAMQIDYEPSFVAIDNGAMSWNCDDDPDFSRALLATESPVLALTRFLHAMSATARNLEYVSRAYPPPSNRRPAVAADLKEDLQFYWRTYKLHMTNLFTFWNAEYILSAALTEALTKYGKHDEIRNGLARFFKPAQDNYFALERRQLRRLVSRFSALTTRDSSVTQEALREHSNLFGFLLAPFNLGSPPSTDDVLRRASELTDGDAELTSPSMGRDTFDDLPPDVRPLALCAEQFAFWKSERLDVMSLADSRAQPMFEEAADRLRVTLDQLFTMTSTEILASIDLGDLQVPTTVLAERAAGYCLALVDGEIAFYQPTSRQITDRGKVLAAGETLEGIGASPGQANGPARVLFGPEESHSLQRGEVLVTTMTRPEMGAALDHAAAFVTDEGGLMCHAAIIAREMRKPCVIGTGTATRHLATGDRLAVNGDSGKVVVLGASQS